MYVQLSDIVHLLLLFSVLICSLVSAGRRTANEQMRTSNNAYGNAPSHTAKCYSCMSKFYEAVWPALSTIYKKPRNFTDGCDDVTGNEGYGMPLIECPTICVRMWEDSNVAGIRIRGNIRGCLDGILHSGFNRSVMAAYRWMHRDSCRPYRKKELLQLAAQSGSGDDSFVNVCTCYSDFCNAAIRPRNFSSSCFWMIVMMLILCSSSMRLLL